MRPVQTSEGPRPPSRRRQRVTTALTIAACLALLGALVAPVVMQPPHSRQASCQSNLKQLGTCVLMYCTDQGGHYPVGFALGGDELDWHTGSVWANWPHALDPYAKSPSIFRCYQMEAKPDGPSVSYVFSTGTLAHSDRATGAQLTWPITVDGYPADDARADEDYASPARSILAYEGDHLTWCGTHGWRYTDDEAGSLGSHVRPLHNGGSNYLFCDAHVKWHRGGTHEPALSHGAGAPPSADGDDSDEGGDGHAEQPKHPGQPGRPGQ
jgi:prepilin-type processing-associated H-X9-DG protein